MDIFIKLKALLLDILFPSICLNCSLSLKKTEKKSGFCANCLSLVALNQTLFCPTCKARFPENKKICHKNSAYLLGAATNYSELPKLIIHQYKYRGWTKLSDLIGGFMLSYLKNTGLNLKNCLVLPIPLHPDRQRERGFNQSELLGKIIAEKYQLPLLMNNLKRVKETRNQAELKNWDDRKENLQNAFSVFNPAEIENRNIVLIDDIHTSGSTIKDAIRALRKAGARKIIALVFAKV